MSSAVNPRRTYDSSRRQEQARANRAAVLDAARESFLTAGYAATTMGAVAAAAGVSVEMVYKSFRTKPGLAKAVFDVAIVGDDEPVPMLQREFVRRNIAEPDPRRKLTDYGIHLAEVGPRTAPLLLVIRDAAASDAAAGDLWADLQAERLAGMTAFADHLATGGYLRDGVTRDEARDVLWVHNAAELWDLLVRQRGWSDERYGGWIGTQLVAALL